jgi:hypothetical protein
MDCCKGKEAAMDLIDRYLKAVAKALPEEQREDIVRELSEDIRSEMEEKEREAGRPLTEAEQQAVLKQRGNPLLLAARYRQDRRALVIGHPLIGPVLFPFYVKVLTFNLGLTAVVIGVIFFALNASGERVSFHDAFSTCLLQLMIQLSVVTLIFTLVERHLMKHPDRWDLSGTGGSLRLDLRSGQSSRKSDTGGVRVPRLESASIIIACAVALVWITEVQSHPFLILGPAAAFLKLAPVWHVMFFPMVLLMVAEIVRAVINLAQPGWTKFRAVYGLLVHCGGLAVIYALLKAGSWVAPLDAAGGSAGQYARAAQIVNQWIYWALIGTAVVSVVQLAVRVTKLFRPGGRGASMLAMSA